MQSMNLVVCPLCSEPLQRQQDSVWRCCHGHCFDEAKQGYLNLLPVQHKKSKQPGDTGHMVTARRDFLEQGFYQPILDQLCQALPASTSRVVDIGCGEGYYTAGIEQNCHDRIAGLHIIGIDISKDAIRKACSRSKNVQWIVASGANAPLAHGKFDCITSLFTPIMTQSYQHLLTQDGTIILAHAGPQHLIELRQKLYQEVNTQTIDTEKSMEKGAFALQDEYSVQFELALDSTDHIENLLSMTPHYWRAKPDAKQSLRTLNNLTVSVDVNISCYRRRTND